MSALALTLIIAAAFAHASWNLLAKRVGGGATFVWLFSAVSVVLYAPIAAAVVAYSGLEFGLTGLLFICGSGCLHTTYFVLLQRGYRSGDLSLVYPLARGTGPMLSTLAAIAFLGERPSPLSLLGALIVVLSVFALAGTGSLTGMVRASGGFDSRTAVGYGLLTGSVIAVYTLWDKHAVSTLLVPPLILDWGTGLTRTLVLTPGASRHRAEIARLWREYRRETLGVAALSPLAYILVLTALRFSPVSAIAPAREISILVGTALGARLLAEGQARRRLAAAATMVIGVIALAVG